MVVFAYVSGEVANLPFDEIHPCENARIGGNLQRCRAGPAAHRITEPFSKEIQWMFGCVGLFEAVILNVVLPSATPAPRRSPR